MLNANYCERIKENGFCSFALVCFLNQHQIPTALSNEDDVIGGGEVFGLIVR